MAGCGGGGVVRETHPSVTRKLVPPPLPAGEIKNLEPHKKYLESPFSCAAGEAFPPEGASWEQEGSGMRVAL